MKKSILLFAALIASALYGFAHTSNPDSVTFRGATIEDISKALTDMGINIYNIDIPVAAKENFNLTIYLDEYDGQKGLIGSKKFSNGNTIVDLRPERNIYMATDKVTFTIDVRDNQNYKWSFFTGQGGSSMPIIRDPKYSNRHDVRPFKPQMIEYGKKIPVLLLGSWWSDTLPGGEEVMRFCGPRKFSPELPADELQNIPHYYIISIELKKP